MSSMAKTCHTAHFVVNRKRQFGEARLSIKRGRNKSNFCCDLFFTPCSGLFLTTLRLSAHRVAQLMC